MDGAAHRDGFNSKLRGLPNVALWQTSELARSVHAVDPLGLVKKTVVVGRPVAGVEILPKDSVATKHFGVVFAVDIFDETLAHAEEFVVFFKMATNQAEADADPGGPKRTNTLYRIPHGHLFSCCGCVWVVPSRPPVVVEFQKQLHYETHTPLHLDGSC